MGKIISIFIAFFIFGGWPAIEALFGEIWMVVVSIVPFLPDILENLLSDPYIITKIIMVVASGFGIWFGVKGGKRLFAVVSFVCEIVGLVSMFVTYS